MDEKKWLLYICLAKGYGGFSYSKSMIGDVMNYIEKQKEHHRKTTLRDELNFIKQKWGIEWDWENDDDDDD